MASSFLIALQQHSTYDKTNFLLLVVWSVQHTWNDTMLDKHHIWLMGKYADHGSRHCISSSFSWVSVSQPPLPSTKHPVKNTFGLRIHRRSRLLLSQEFYLVYTRHPFRWLKSPFWLLQWQLLYQQTRIELLQEIVYIWDSHKYSYIYGKAPTFFLLGWVHFTEAARFLCTFLFCLLCW